MGVGGGGELMLCPAHKGWPDMVVGTWSGLGIRRIVVEMVVRNMAPDPYNRHSDTDIFF